MANPRKGNPAQSRKINTKAKASKAKPRLLRRIASWLNPITLISKLLPGRFGIKQAIFMAVIFAVIGTVGILLVQAYGIIGPFGSFEQDQAIRTNNVRSQNGLPGLRHAECLHKVAQAWTREMASTYNFVHNPALADSINNTCGGGWTLAGENIGWSDGGDSAGVFEAFMNSPGHRKNILDPYTVAGFGVYKSDTGRLWVTQVFATCHGCGGAYTADAAYSPDPNPNSGPPPGVTMPVRKFDATVNGWTGVTVNAGGPYKTIIGNLTAESFSIYGNATVLPYACPAGIGEQGTSHINFTPGQTIANQVITGSDANGNICIFTAGNGQARIVWDTQSETNTFTAHAPQRLYDSRTHLGRRLNPNEVVAINVRNPSGGSVAGQTIHGNLTATEPESAAWLAVYPCAEGWKGTSNVQFAGAQTVAIHAVVKADVNSQICVLSPVRSHVIWDEISEHTAFPAHSPSRILDTRYSGHPGANSYTTVHTGAGAYKTVVATLTALNAGAQGYAAVLPFACNYYFNGGYSNINYKPGMSIANNVVTQTDANGHICIYTTAAADFIWDQVSESNLFAYQAARRTTTLTAPLTIQNTTAPSTTGLGAGKHNQTAFAYTGTWGATTTTGAFNNDEKYSNTAGSTYTVKFKGTKISVWTMKHPNYGLAEYSVDGGGKITVDHYNASRVFNFNAYNSSVLPAGDHTLTVRVLGTKQAAAQGAYIAADMVEVFGTTTATPPPATTPPPSTTTYPTGTFSVNDDVIGTGVNKYTYSGSWCDTTTTGAYNNDEHCTGTAGHFYTFKFYGTQANVYSMKHPYYGIAGYSVDGGVEKMVDHYNSSRVFGFLAYQTPILARGEHTIKVRVTGTKQSAATGTYVAADRVEVKN